MSNPYEAPHAALENEQSQAEKLAKAALRPWGMMVLLVSFLLVSLIRIGADWLDGGFWWLVQVAITALILFAFRKLWWGDESTRKSAVWICLILALLLFLFSIPMSSVELYARSLADIFNVAESAWFLFAGGYLIKVGDHRFFSGTTPLTTTD